MDLKDKLKLFQRIRNDKYAETDLQLLKAKWPNHLFIPRFERDPKRYAYDIQYALLDAAREEEIIKNRTSADGSSKTSTKKKPTANKKSSPIEKEENTADGSSKTLTEDTVATTDNTIEAESSKKK